MKIGIFGGSFNPPHKMHLMIAESLLKNILDKIIFVPTGKHYPKDELIDENDRYNMLKLICTDQMSVSKHEFEKKIIYTYQTLDYFQTKYPNEQIYFICGSDNLKEIENWKRHDYILKKYPLIVINRGDNMKKIKEKHDIIIHNINNSFISSSKIRGLIKKNLNPQKYLEKPILDYIEENSLYK